MTSYSTQNPSGDKPAEHLMERLDADQIWCLSPPHLLTNHWGMMQSGDSSETTSCQCRRVPATTRRFTDAGLIWKPKGLLGIRVSGIGRDLDRSSHPICQSGITLIRSRRNASGWVLNVSRAGDPTASLGILSQSPVTLTVRNFLPTFKRNLPYPSLYPVSGRATLSPSPFLTAAMCP